MAVGSLSPVSNELAVAGCSPEVSNGTNSYPCLLATAFRYTTMKIEKLVESYNDGLRDGYHAARLSKPEELANRRQAYSKALSKYHHREIARFHAAGWIAGIRLVTRSRAWKPTPKPTAIKLVGLYTLNAA